MSPSTSDVIAPSSLVRSFRRGSQILRMVGRGLVDKYHPILVQIVPMRRCNLACTYCNEYDKTSDPVPLPTNLVQRLARNLLENQRSRMQLELKLFQEARKNNPDAKYEASTPEALAQAAHAEAVRNLSIEFVMMALADKEKVEVTDADLEKHLSELAKERDKSVARLKAEMQREDPNLQQLRGQLRLEKALDLLESKAQVTEGA